MSCLTGEFNTLQLVRSTRCPPATSGRCTQQPQRRGQKLAAGEGWLDTSPRPAAPDLKQLFQVKLIVYHVEMQATYFPLRQHTIHPLAGCLSGAARRLHLPPASRCCYAPPPNPGRRVRRRSACARCRTSAPRTRTGMYTLCWPTSRHPPFRPPAPAPPAAAAAVRQSASWFLGAPQLPQACCHLPLAYVALSTAVGVRKGHDCTQRRAAQILLTARQSMPAELQSIPGQVVPLLPCIPALAQLFDRPSGPCCCMQSL